MPDVLFASRMLALSWSTLVTLGAGVTHLVPCSLVNMFCMTGEHSLVFTLKTVPLEQGLQV